MVVSRSRIPVAVASVSGQVTVIRSPGELFFYPDGTDLRLPVLQDVCSAFGPTYVCLQVQAASYITLRVIPGSYFRSVDINLISRFKLRPVDYSFPVFAISQPGSRLRCFIPFKEPHRWRPFIAHLVRPKLIAKIDLSSVLVPFVCTLFEQGLLTIVNNFKLPVASCRLPVKRQNCHPDGSQDPMPRSYSKEIPACTGMTSVRQPATVNRQPATVL